MTKAAPDGSGWAEFRSQNSAKEIATPLRGNPKHEILNPKQYLMSKIPMTKAI
jgi:hypothetical protein